MENKHCSEALRVLSRSITFDTRENTNIIIIIIIMKFSSFALASFSFFEVTSSVTSFSPTKAHTSIVTRRMGYLDDLTSDLAAPDSNPIPEEEAREANVMSKEKIVGAGPGDWDSYVEFDEFDGGDGQMGVAGDGNKGLDKFDMTQIAKSKSMSGKNKKKII
jgi:hypothetical protein